MQTRVVLVPGEVLVLPRLVPQVGRVPVNAVLPAQVPQDGGAAGAETSQAVRGQSGMGHDGCCEAENQCTLKASCATQQGKLVNAEMS